MPALMPPPTAAPRTSTINDIDADALCHPGMVGDCTSPILPINRLADRTGGVERAEEALLATGRRTLRHVAAVAEPGGVRLVGFVPSFHDKQLATAAVVGAGVEVVTNAISVCRLC